MIAIGVTMPLSHSDEVALLAKSILHCLPTRTPLRDGVWLDVPPVQLIDCVLSIRQRYDLTVVPRIHEFKRRFPDIKSCEDLEKLIAKYSSPQYFLKSDLNFDSNGRAQRIFLVNRYLIRAQEEHNGCTQRERLQAWARSENPNGYRNIGVKGFAIASFQYLRMLFGADTVKPDSRVLEFIVKALRRPVEPAEAVILVEEAAKKLNRSAKEVDVGIWESIARQGTKPHHCR